MRKTVILVFIVALNVALSGCLDGGDGDTDGDGLTDDREREGWDVQVVYPGNSNTTVYHVTSDPGEKDTDGDGLTDFEELFGTNGKSTDPRKKDTDNDGLTDYEEHTYGTDPTHWMHDMDSDLFLDYEELDYFLRKNFDRDTVLSFMQTPDIDGDGVLDGNDRDPLRDLRVKIRVTGMYIWAFPDGRDEEIIVAKLNVSFNDQFKVFTETLIPDPVPDLQNPENGTFNLTYEFDLDDTARWPGDLNATAAFTLFLLDWDRGEPLRFKDLTDGVDEYDYLRVWDGDQLSYWANFDIFSDCGWYRMDGVDGIIWFELVDVSVPWN
jgi:hypothetical protein